MADLQNYRTNAGFKKNKRQWEFWLFSGGLFILGALLIGTLYFILRSPWLKVKNINAPDLPGISRDDILNALKIDMLRSKMRAMLGPNNILFWEFGSHPSSLFRFPALENIRVDSNFWDRSVEVAAEERELWGALCNSSGSMCYGLDENGIIFSEVPNVSGSLILKINDMNDRFFVLGQPVFSRPEWFGYFKQSIDTLNRNGFRVISAEIGDLSLREWTARVVSGPEFHFSLTFTPENFDSILKNLGNKVDLGKTTYVDFRVPERIYYK
jgi:hypothetical protein